MSGCSNGTTPPPPPNDPPPPPAPKLGPTVSFNTVLGGLEAHITDRSGVSSQCTYATDDFNRSFALPANSTYDLRIVPAVPQIPELDRHDHMRQRNEHDGDDVLLSAAACNR